MLHCPTTSDDKSSAVRAPASHLDLQSAFLRLRIVAAERL